MSHRLGLALALAAVYLIWGTTYFAVRIGLESMPPFLLAATRFTAAGLLLALVTKARGWRRPSLADWGHAAALGLTLVTVSAGVSAWSMTTVASGQAALLSSLTPCWIVLVDSLCRSKIPGGRSLAGLATGIGASVVLLGPGEAQADTRGGAGLLLAGLAWALGSVLGRLQPTRVPLLQSTAMYMLVGGLALFPVALAAGELTAVHAIEMTVRSTVALVYLTVFGSIVVLCAYSWLMVRASAAATSSHAYVNPMVAVVVGVLAGNETLSQGTITALGLSAAAALLLVSARDQAGR